VSRVYYRYPPAERVRDEIWCEEHVMSVYADEWEGHINDWH
jgi:hypothetical protein